ncbi:MAG: M12 family metallopeptidase, partial [Verrucomicrobiota bacterium]|nr:M12 family metallopeptidase [Verrucomicrobiota bacterium]
MSAGFYVNTVSPGSVPWPGGVVPYVIDPALSPAQRQTYLNGLREWELAANVQFIPRTTQTQYILFKYNPAGPNSVSGSNPQIVAINALTRGQICHEMGHSFGLLHEHARGDQATYVKVLTANITSGNQSWFDIDPNGTAQGPYDFESVMHSSRDRFSIQPGVLDTLEA